MSEKKSPHISKADIFEHAEKREEKEYSRERIQSQGEKFSSHTEFFEPKSLPISRSDISEDAEKSEEKKYLQKLVDSRVEKISNNTEFFEPKSAHTSKADISEHTEKREENNYSRERVQSQGEDFSKDTEFCEPKPPHNSKADNFKEDFETILDRQALLPPKKRHDFAPQPEKIIKALANPDKPKLNVSEPRNSLELLGRINFMIKALNDSDRQKGQLKELKALVETGKCGFETLLGLYQKYGCVGEKKVLGKKC